MTSSDSYPTQAQTIHPTRMDVLVWALCCVPLIQAMLLWQMTDLYTLTFFLIQLVRLAGLIGAILVLLWTARCLHDQRRWAWYCMAVSILSTVLFGVVVLLHVLGLDQPYYPPLLTGLLVAMYTFGLLSGALYFRRNMTQLGNALRVVIAGSTMAYAGLLLIGSALPRVFFSWYTQNIDITPAPLIALDVGVLFAVLVVIRRYRFENLFVPLLLISLTCLLIADTLGELLALCDVPPSLLYDLEPLLTLHSILLAFAAYRDRTYPLQVLNQTARGTPLRDWLLWTSLPLTVVLAAFFAASLVGQVPFVHLLLLALLAVIHEILAALDYRRVLNNLKSSNQQLALAKDQAQTEAATTEAFLIRLIHDLAPPVQGLLTVVNFSAAWRAEQRRFQELATKQVGLLKRFVEQARSYLQARTFSLSKTNVPLLPICWDAVEAANLLAQSRGVQIVQEILVDTPTLWGDETAIRRILDNLLTNAVQITPRGGEVVLSVTRFEPEQVQVAVHDQGPGIPPEKQAYLFKPYTALQNLDGQEHPSPTGTGLGLGLAIVKELTTALGGGCGVHSTLGAGSTFYVRLPVPSTSSAATSGEVEQVKGFSNRE